ncbi:hypothetical protein AB0M92_24545 [Streptomyces sp. NPDC051582]|uniref:hypothetical protein n=1 Tax=Streptomyces sp. NPDC051582 TaxID=3155167 RepID=UPI003419C9A6
MGAESFIEFQEGTTAAEAFSVAQVTALRDLDEGCDGFLASKDSYKVVSDTGLTMTAAEALAAQLLGGPEDGFWKWDPAGAIAVTGEGASATSGWLFFGWAD